VRVLVACEYSGRVRESFRALGHDAWSCDLLESEDGSAFHLQWDVFELLNEGWDLMIAHPPCTDLAVSGARHFAEKIADGRQGKALGFVQSLMDAPIKKIAIENPISIISSKIRKPDQIVQPWWFGHPETKSTCLWLKNLPPLRKTNNVHDFMMTLPRSQRNRVHFMSPGPDRWRERSRTYQGLADAMADQWGRLDA
jgi:site-specific DNA-cytosine methylase